MTIEMHVKVHRFPLHLTDVHTVRCYSCQREPDGLLFELWVGAEQSFMCMSCADQLNKLLSSVIKRTNEEDQI